MATYAVGDVQGCFATLERLLARVGFDPGADRLWLVGDLVNRGPRSLEVLRFARGLGDRAAVVLGNHDVHLLARAAGLARRKRFDTLDDVLAAPDRDELLGWLRARPLLHREAGHVMVHAGLLPGWTIDDAAARAREVEALLAAGDLAPLLDRPRATPAAVTLAAMTRLRVCTTDGEMEPKFKGPPEEAPAGTRPWFAVPGRKSAGTPIVFGHWATLGLRVRPGDFYALDSGCVWGGALTALRLDDGALFQEPAAD